jgi:hypothetical protein
MADGSEDSAGFVSSLLGGSGIASGGIPAPSFSSAARSTASNTLNSRTNNVLGTGSFVVGSGSASTTASPNFNENNMFTYIALGVAALVAVYVMKKL